MGFSTRLRSAGVLSAAPAAVLLVVALGLPVVAILHTSLTGGSSVLSHYAAVVASPAVHQVSVVTLQIAVVTTTVCVLVGLPIAKYLTTCGKTMRTVVLLAATTPLWTPIVVRLYAWTLILGRNGLLNDVLVGIGLRSEPADLLFTRGAVIVGMTHMLLPYVILILYSTLRSLDPDLPSAAASLGAGRLRIAFRVTLPLAKPGIYASSMLVFILCLGFFITPVILGGASSITAAQYIERQVALLQWGPASAFGTAIVAVVFVMYLAFERQFGSRPATGLGS